jgi:alpha-soluble NSF attachment protein
LRAADAVEYYRTAISMLCDAGRFSNAAKLQKQIAEIYEHQDSKEEALEAFRQAADYFTGENQTSSANNMMLKVAQFSAQLERCVLAWCYQLLDMLPSVLMWDAEQV